MRKLIDVDSDTKKKISKTFKVTPANVSQALRYKRNSSATRAMRKMAMENGGTLFIEAPKDMNHEDTNLLDV